MVSRESLQEARWLLLRSHDVGRRWSGDHHVTAMWLTRRRRPFWLQSWLPFLFTTLVAPFKSGFFCGGLDTILLCFVVILVVFVVHSFAGGDSCSKGHDLLKFRPLIHKLWKFNIKRGKKFFQTSKIHFHLWVTKLDLFSQLSFVLMFTDKCHQFRFRTN